MFLFAFPAHFICCSCKLRPCYLISANTAEFPLMRYVMQDVVLSEQLPMQHLTHGQNPCERICPHNIERHAIGAASVMAFEC